MKALIFDMDGVMIDSELHWQDDEWAMIAKMIPHWTEADHAKILGKSITDIHALLVKDYGLPISREAFLAQVEGIAHKIYAEETNLMEGLLEVLNKLKGQVPMAMASSAKRNWIEQVVQRFSLQPFFKAIVSYEDIGNRPGKPAPDIYLFTAKKLGMAPADCWVIEDSQNGVLSAKAAGMKVIGFKNGFNESQNLSQAHTMIKSLKELDTKPLTS
ncbi:MAG: HAD family phosphatase [Candidatus Peregrinibacteria bacterium]